MGRSPVERPGAGSPTGARRGHRLRLDAKHNIAARLRSSEAPALPPPASCYLDDCSCASAKRYARYAERRQYSVMVTATAASKAKPVANPSASSGTPCASTATGITAFMADRPAHASAPLAHDLRAAGSRTSESGEPEAPLSTGCVTITRRGEQAASTASNRSPRSRELAQCPCS